VTSHKGGRSEDSSNKLGKRHCSVGLI
jgi:hypothetical protein